MLSINVTVIQLQLSIGTGRQEVRDKIEFLKSEGIEKKGSRQLRYSLQHTSSLANESSVTQGLEGVWG
jgi:biotin operon repressor